MNSLHKDPQCFFFLFLRIEHDIAHAALGSNVIGQVKLIGKRSVADMTLVTGGLGMLDHHVPLNTIAVLGAHIA